MSKRGRRDYNPRNANGARRRGVKAHLRALGNPCHICGYPIDYGAHHLAKTAFVVDEIVPVSQGGKPYGDNCAAAHRCCNAWRGAKPLTPRLRAALRARFEREVLGMRPTRERPPQGARKRENSREW